jgi:predicted ATP-dependent serine protease
VEETAMTAAETHPLPLISPKGLIEQVENTDQGDPIPTPYSTIVGGIPTMVKGRMTVVGANTEVGKTVWGIQCFKYVLDINPDLRACYITTEMTPSDIFERLQYQFDTEDDAKAWIRDKDAIVSEPGVDANEVVEIIKHGGFDFVVLDHVHDLPFEGHEDLARKVRRIGAMAPFTNTAILMLAQTKQPDPLARALPTKYDFSYSKAIVEVAAQAFILWKEDDHDETTELHCVKNRFGPKSDPLSLRLNPRTVVFDTL